MFTPTPYIDRKFISNGDISVAIFEDDPPAGESLSQSLEDLFKKLKCEDKLSQHVIDALTWDFMPPEFVAYTPFTADGEEWQHRAWTKVLVADSRKGLKLWQGRVLSREAEGQDEEFATQAAYFTVNSDGESSSVRFTKPKLVKRAKSQDTKGGQAVFDVQSQYLKKIDKGYLPLYPADGELEEITVRPLPMKGKVWDASKHESDYGWMIQPKFDGMRMVTNGVEGWSVTGKRVDPKLIEALLASGNTGTIEVAGVPVCLDGELMLAEHYVENNGIAPEDRFSHLMSKIRTFDPLDNEDEIVYRVFDLVMEDAPFVRRHNLLDEWFQTPQGHIAWEVGNCRFVNVTHVDKDDVADVAALMIEEGHEGAMVRRPDGIYEPGKRTDALYKVKPFMDAEFQVVGHKMGTGERDWQVNLELLISPDVTCWAVLNGSKAWHRYVKRNIDNYIGQMATVTFQGYTNGGSLRHPNVKGFRLEEDIDLEGEHTAREQVTMRIKLKPSGKMEITDPDNPGSRAPASGPEGEVLEALEEYQGGTIQEIEYKTIHFTQRYSAGEEGFKEKDLDYMVEDVEGLRHHVKEGDVIDPGVGGMQDMIQKTREHILNIWNNPEKS